MGNTVEVHAQVVMICNGLNTLLNSLRTIINQKTGRFIEHLMLGH